MSVKATILLITAAHASVLVPRNCANVPSSADPDALDAMYNVLVSRGVSDKALLATFETAWVESHVNALTCGDQDSVGVFQQRPSQGWGTAAQCADVAHSTNAFLDAVQFNEARYPHFGAGMLAQSVQISEYAKRYGAAESKARRLLAQAQRRAGQPAYRPSAQGAPADHSSLAPGSLSGTCGAFYAVQPGDSCATMGGLYGASTAQLVAWNPSLNADCSGVVAGYTYCVSSPVAVPPATAARGIDRRSCTGYSSPVQASDTCASIGAAYGVNPPRIVRLNRSLNSQCNNMIAGESYCLTSIRV